MFGKRIALTVILCFELASCKLWKNGVVHYSLNKKDYDPHSQDLILSTFSQIEREICVKFFNTPQNYNVSDVDKVLLVSNPNKLKYCTPQEYDYDRNVIEMPIGYKCLNQQDIARIIVDMLKASIDQPVQISNSQDLERKVQALQQHSLNMLLSASDRNYINTAYYEQCSDLLHIPDIRRSSGDNMKVSLDNKQYYEDKLWPLGIVLYGMSEGLQNSPDYEIIHRAMATIERASCIVFQYMPENDLLAPNNFLWLSNSSDEYPALGYVPGNQTVSAGALAHGAAGHAAHALAMLLRALGVHMMSNRYDRDNYVTINWKHVEKSKEHFLERAPREAWFAAEDDEGLAAYDFNSVTHAPVNFMCKDCSMGEQTVQPIQDHLWYRSLSLGHREDLSESDIKLLEMLYGEQCKLRFVNND